MAKGPDGWEGAQLWKESEQEMGSLLRYTKINYSWVHSRCFLAKESPTLFDIFNYMITCYFSGIKTLILHILEGQM